MTDISARDSPWSGQDGKNDAPFNFSLLFYISLNKLMEAKDEAYMRNDVQGWYKYINRIFLRISFKLNKEEYEELYSELQKARSLILNNQDCSEHLHKADLLIITFMDHYKMIFPRIERSMGLNKIRDRYKLPERKEEA